MSRLHPLDLISHYQTIGFDELPSVVDLTDPPLPCGDYERELGSLDLDDDGGEWEPVEMPVWFVAACWACGGSLAGFVLGLWRATW
jgi:hypothetical protein